MFASDDRYIPRQEALFPAHLTASTLSGGTYYYDFTEQSFDPTTGAFTDAPAGRAGTFAGGFAFAVEANNANVSVPTYAWLRLRGIVAGVLWYEFSAPPTGSITVKEDDGTPTVTGVTTVEFDHTQFSVTDLTGGAVKITSLVEAPLTVEEDDGTPTVTPVTTIKFDHNQFTVTDETGGVVLIQTNAGYTFVSNETWVVNSGVTWEIDGPGNITFGSTSIVTFNGTLEICGPLEYCYNNVTIASTPIDNWNPTLNKPLLRVTATVSGAIVTGLAGGVDKLSLFLVNVGTDVVTLKHQDANSLAANRFSIVGGHDLSLTTDDWVYLWYDGTSGFWRVYFWSRTFGARTLDKNPGLVPSPASASADTDYLAADATWKAIPAGSSLKVQYDDTTGAITGVTTEQFDHTSFVISGATPTATISRAFVASRLQGGSTQSIPSGTVTIFGGLDYINDSYSFDPINFSIAGANPYFTIPAGYGGYYEVAGFLTWAGNITGVRYLDIAVYQGDGVTLDRILGVDCVSPASATPITQFVSGIGFITAGYMVKLRAFQNSGGALTAGGTDVAGNSIPVCNAFWIRKVS